MMRDTNDLLHFFREEAPFPRTNIDVIKLDHAFMSLFNLRRDDINALVVYGMV